VTSPKDPKTPSADADYAVPTGTIDVYDPDYVPPPPAVEVTDPAAAEGFSQLVRNAPTSDPAQPFPPQHPPGAYTSQAPGPVGMMYGAPANLANPDDAPLLPPELGADGALQHAVGAPSARARQRAAAPRDDGDDGEPGDGTPKRSKRTMIVASLAIVAGLGAAALVFLGRANAQRYVIACDASKAIAQQGRSFPPWGVRSMPGAEWAPIALPANAECQTRETENLGELTTWYLEILIDRATTTLTQKDLLDVSAAPAANGKPVIAPLDTVSAELDHALLLARDPDRRDQRKEITRLQGDVAYWRAVLRLRDASAILVDAAKQFDAANAQHPRHTTDSAAWSTFLHHLSDELRSGPNGAPIVAPIGVAGGAQIGPSEPVPVGSALPVEPDSGSGASTGSAAPVSNVPAGGVLL
jgi:hypothetical protein